VIKLRSIRHRSVMPEAWEFAADTHISKMQSVKNNGNWQLCKANAERETHVDLKIKYV